MVEMDVVGLSHKKLDDVRPNLQIQKNVSKNECLQTCEGNKTSYPLKWFYVSLFLLATYINYCIQSVIEPFYPQEAYRKGMSETIIGLVFSCFSFVMFMSSPFVGKMIPKFKAKKVLILGYCLSGFCNILFGFLHYVEDVKLFALGSFFIRILEGLGVQAAESSTFVLFSVLYPNDGGFVRGLFETVIGFGLGTGPLVGGILYTFGGFGLPFYLLGGLLILNAFGTCYILPDLENSETDERGSFWELLKLPQTMVCAVAVFADASINAALNPTLEVQLRKFELTPIGLGLVFLTGAATYAITSPLWGKLVDKLKCHWWLMSFGLLLNSVAFSFLGPSNFMWFIQDSLWLNVISLGCTGIFGAMSLMATYQGILDGAIENGFADNETTHSIITALWFTCYAFGCFFGPTASGIILEHFGFPAVTTFCLMTTFIASVLCFVYFLGKNKRKN